MMSSLRRLIPLLVVSLSLLIAGALLSGCASVDDGTQPARGIKGDPTTGQDRLWEVHSRTMRELAY